MQKRNFSFITGILFALIFSIFPSGNRLLAQKQQPLQLVDSKATKQTRALFVNLQKLAKTNILFGHEDALAYGVHWKDEKGRSDVKDVCGSHPAVFGWELSKLGKYSHNIDTVDFEKLKGWIKEAYKMGGVNTISWHMDNFVTGGDAWDTGKRVVAALLPGGSRHEAYKAKLDLFVEYVNDLKAGGLFKHPVPIIFRPFHEQTGNWFWWGKKYCSPEEYIALWRFTVHYLRDEKKLHNLLYAFSTDIFKNKEDYLKRYPGDEFVDILGLDDYYDVSALGNPKNLSKRLRMLVELAEEKGKVAALTETGVASIPNKKWWTKVLLKPIKAEPKASQIAYLLVWRNARLSHHFGPFAGHPSAPDFLKFSKDPLLLFQNKLPDMYRLKH